VAVVQSKASSALKLKERGRRAAESAGCRAVTAPRPPEVAARRGHSAPEGDGNRSEPRAASHLLRDRRKGLGSAGEMGEQGRASSYRR
jgi:hypothetical protein